ncbi:metal-dependent hydrolase [Lucifera butyrica]|uniref:Metal-dependent hydrolase n=1 Tax=Lucifera butyrica TaxID=1351585 RepID=A0A498R8T0_9FIRM|nr:dihydropyrimidinase [Lucifera butyrica]VBB06682.1 metal-dependent hydrolase [Lucifera butyrica]
MGIVLKGATVITAVDSYAADVRLEGETIAGIGADLSQAGDAVLDVAGCYLFPGGIDPHTHLDLPVGDFSTADDFASGTAAAVCGGTTTIIDFATQNRGETLQAALANWHAKAQGKCFADYGFHMAITDWRDDVNCAMEDMVKLGVTSFKLYMAYKNVLQVEDGVIFRALQRSREIGALIGLHCENGDVVAALVRQALQAGNTAPKFHPLTRPAAAEREAVSRAIALAEMAAAPVYIVHLSTAAGFRLITEARTRGIPVYAETCPQYLLLDESRYETEDFSGAKYVMSPPLRRPEDAAMLWRGLKTGMLDTVATDHCSFNYAGQKDRGRHDFSKIPNGAPGIEHRLGLLYTYGVCTGRIGLNQFVALTSTNAAKLFGLFPRKGTIAAGSDADIIVWDPAPRTTITAAGQRQRVDYTPYEGFELAGRVRHVFLRGRQVVEGGRLKESPCGKYLSRRSFTGKGGGVCLPSF